MASGAIFKDEIWGLLREPDLKERLIITPLLDPEKQVGASAVDVRLGNEFIVVSKTSLPGLDLCEYQDMRRLIRSYQSRTRVEYGQDFVLHPGQLVLGSTLEYIKLPLSVAAYVIGRSSWGRTGLIIATATAVAPGYCGSLTLEIVNVGEIPLTVYPGVRIAQLVLHRGTGVARYDGRHQYATGPGFTRIFEDPEMGIWTHWPGWHAAAPNVAE